jgi:hypothetical protein
MWGGKSGAFLDGKVDEGEGGPDIRGVHTSRRQSPSVRKSTHPPQETGG